MKVKRIIVSIPDEVVVLLDKMVEKSGLSSRNMLIVQLVREGLGLSSFRKP